MAKISAQQKAENFQVYSDIVEELFWELGWFNLKYSDVIERIQKRTNNPKFKLSTLQNYYPHKADFVGAIRGKVLPVFMEYLDLSSANSLAESWVNALDERPFRLVLSLLIGNLVANETSSLSVNGLNKLTELVIEALGDQGREALEVLLGKTIYRLAQETVIK